jgi:hypothetical protein
MDAEAHKNFEHDPNLHRQAMLQDQLRRQQTPEYTVSSLFTLLILLEERGAEAVRVVLLLLLLPFPYRSRPDGNI